MTAHRKLWFGLDILLLVSFSVLLWTGPWADRAGHG
jgi:hypothetical protein